MPVFPLELDNVPPEHLELIEALEATYVRSPPPFVLD